MIIEERCFPRKTEKKKSTSEFLIYDLITFGKKDREIQGSIILADGTSWSQA